LLFTAQAGETLALRVAGQTTVPATQNVTYTVYQPDGSYLNTLYVSQADAVLDLPNLPMTGEYLIFADPYLGATASAQILIASGSVGHLQTTGDGRDSYAPTIPGQSVYLSFTAKQGENLGLGISDLVSNTGDYVSVWVQHPEGWYVTNSICFGSLGGCDLNLSDLSAGTYTVAVSPIDSSQKMSFKALLSQDQQLTLRRGVAQTLTLGRRGQNGRLEFTAQAGEALALQIAGQVTQPAGATVYYTVYQPNGNHLDALWVSGAGGILDLPAMPSSGTYWIYVDPSYGATASSKLTLQVR
jgi:hypothetical protein